MKKKIGFLTLGCKVNIYESNALKNELIKRGYLVVEPQEDCDAFIINTCSVTNMADAKSRKMIHRMSKLNKDAVLCVMGCYSQTNKEALKIEGVDVIVGNGNKLDVIPMLEGKLLDKSIEKQMKILEIKNFHEFENLEVTTYDHTRAFVKIEDGCENFCAYCIIPYARGPVRSKPAKKVIEELRRITNEGYYEVVLAGIHTGRYNDNNLNLTGLIKKILKEVPKLKRLRLSSIEINEVDDEFIELLKTNDVIANHLHLPLQSGSDLVLEKMERKYDTAFFEERVNKIKEARPDISITTDVIVGFPYENDEEYNKSVEFIKKIGISKIHVFPYSIRKGTKAADMPQINESIKKARAKNLIEVSKKLENEYMNKFINQEVEAIIEHKIDDETMLGHTSNYLQVIVPYDEKLLRQNVLVRLNRIDNDKIIGEVINN